jgi:hypothetical protein
MLHTPLQQVVDVGDGGCLLVGANLPSELPNLGGSGALWRLHSSLLAQVAIMHKGRGVISVLASSLLALCTSGNPGHATETNLELSLQSNGVVRSVRGLVIEGGQPLPHLNVQPQ